ncbi:hypothetical protein [Flavobacterium ardleyense]|uniref:hypothetical protein n=1 Tax=Flavobacterium ardleyense TaxID=2038737 RepID=UPI00298D0D16|nr:hypothetical protein [Flavobacterium ardleyense]
MAKDFAGKGGKRPQIEIPISKILLDHQNPRLVQYTTGSDEISQFDLIKILQENFDTETIAMSLKENGYFDEEPLIVVPNNLPEDINLEEYSYEDAVKILQEYTENHDLTFTVVEGNRRVSSIKLLTDSTLREKLGIDKFYPKVENKDIIEDISNIPCIVYPTRDKVSNYLGVRHIAGLLKWEAFAKAAYIANTIKSEVDKGKSVAAAIKEVQNTVGDRSDVLKKQFVAFKLWEEAKHDLPEFDTEPILYKFSLLNVLYNSPLIREYIGVKSYSEINFDNRIVPLEKLDEFQSVLTWVFGNKFKSERPALTDSRLITSTLSHVVHSPEAVAYLRKYKDLEGAFDRTNGEKEYLIKNLSKAFVTIQESLKFAYKYAGDKEIREKVKDLEEVIEVLKNNLEVNSSQKNL